MVSYLRTVGNIIFLEKGVSKLSSEKLFEVLYGD